MVPGSERPVGRQILEGAEAAIVEVGFGRRDFSDLELGVWFFLEEGDAVPMNFEGLSKAEALGARREFAFEIDEDGFGFSGGRAEEDGDETEGGSVPGVEVGAGTFLDGEFEGEERLLAIRG